MIGNLAYRGTIYNTFDDIRYTPLRGMLTSTTLVPIHFELEASLDYVFNFVTRTVFQDRF